MSITYHPNVDQGSDAWLELRRGMVTASVVGQLIASSAPSGLTVACPECGVDADAPCVSRARKEPTAIKTLHPTRVPPIDEPPVLSVATGDTARSLTALLVAERITGHIDPVYVSDDMMRGTLDEPIARALYAKHYAPVTTTGFVVRAIRGVEIGYSPDGLVGDEGLIEVKSRRAKKHLQTILADQVPAENTAQIQAGLLVTGREWCDYLSYCGGMPMWRKRVYADVDWREAIIAAVLAFEETAAHMVATYSAAVQDLPMTERVDHFSDAIEVG